MSEKHRANHNVIRRKVTPHIIRHSTRGTTVPRHPNETWSGIPIPHAKTAAAAVVVCLYLRNIQTTEIITDKHVRCYLQILGWSGAKIGHGWDGPEWGHADFGGNIRTNKNSLSWTRNKKKQKWREYCGRRKEKRDEEEDSKMGRIWSCQHSWGIFCPSSSPSYSSHLVYVFLLSSHPSFASCLCFPHFLLSIFIFRPSPSTPHRDICFYHFVFHRLLFLLYFPSLTSFLYLLFFFLFWGEFRLKLTDSQMVTLGRESWEWQAAKAQAWVDSWLQQGHCFPWFSSSFPAPLFSFFRTSH